MILPVVTQAPVEDRMVIVAKDADISNPLVRLEWEMVLGKSMPHFLHGDRGTLGAPDDMLVRWTMPREDAESFGFWGVGCACCGTGSPQDSEVYEFDTNYDQTDWYIKELGEVTE